MPEIEENFDDLVKSLMRSKKFNQLESQQIALDSIVGYQNFLNFEGERRRLADAEMAQARSALAF